MGRKLWRRLRHDPNYLKFENAMDCLDSILEQASRGPPRMLDPRVVGCEPPSKPLEVGGLRRIDSLSVDLCQRVSSQHEECALLQGLILAKRRVVHFGPSSIMDSQTPETFHDEDAFRLHMEEMRKCIKLKRRQRRILSLVPAMLLVPLGFLLARLLSWGG